MTYELIERVAIAAKREPGRVRPVLELLVGDRPHIEDELRPVAEELNAARRDHAVEEFLAGSLPTDQVIDRLPSITTRQGVHRLRRAGKLVGRTVGNTTWFPAWQFSPTGLRDGLADILARIGRFTGDAIAADRIMRLPRAELDGATIVEALDDDRRETALSLLDALGAG